MRDEINLLHISPYFNYVCGVSKYVYLVLRGLKELSVNNVPKLNLHFITNGGDALSRLSSIDIRPDIITFKRGFRNLFFIIPNTFQLEKYCISHKIDIIHSHHRYTELLSYLVKKGIFRKTEKHIKIITTAHSIVKGYKSISFKSDKIIAVSNTVKNNLINNYGISEKKIVQFYNPVDKSVTNEIQINRNDFKIDNKSKVILFVGRYSKEKGIDILIKAFLEVSKTYNLFLLIITDADENIKSHILRKNGRIIFIKPSDDITMYYKLSDIVIVPSLVESCPYVVLESGMNKKFLIASNINGINEFIEDGKHAILFEANNYKALIDSIQKALKISNSQKQQFVENLYEKTNTFSDPRSYAEKLLKIYIEMLNDS
ncbi:glycosyltransferase family 4 protein [Ignavibacteria bacterium 4148-Me]|uniref:glycosyltransferase family 4 protein n=1 Tax=Rosettibacter primus TaxID=3111523 RepID=UPI00336C2298